LIMTDEITADLPTDSQKNRIQSLHASVQRLENLVEMLMQQKNEALEPPQLENSFSALIMTDEITADHVLLARVQRLENLVTMLMQQKNEEFERLL